MNFNDIKIQHVSKKEFETAGKVWPLIVPEGIVMTRARDKAIVFNDSAWDKKSYAINGVAQNVGFLPVEPIWMLDPKTLLDALPRRKSLSDLIQVGLDLLGYKEGV